MEYREYIDARMEGMYTIIESSDSVVLEAFKKEKAEKERNMAKKGFFRYMDYMYGDKFNKQEILDAKTPEEKKAIGEKYAKDFADYRKKHKVELAISTGALASALAVVKSPLNPTAIMCCYIFYGLSVVNSIANIITKHNKNKENKN